MGCNEGGTHANLGFTESDITADNSVHRPWGLHIIDDRLDGIFLIRCLFERKSADKTLIFIEHQFVSESPRSFATSLDLEQFHRNVMYFLLGFFASSLPAIASEPMQWRIFIACSRISAYQVQRRNWNIELVLVGIFDTQKFSFNTRYCQCF